MKKIIILIAMLCSFGFCKSKQNVVDGIIVTTHCDETEYYEECETIITVTSASKSCGYKINGKTHYDYQYNKDTKEISVWRPCEGTLLFRGKILYIWDDNLLVDGYCYDKSGLKVTKQVNRITKCK